MHSKRESILGSKYNILTILEYVYSDKHGKAVYRCLCECGNEVEIIGAHIKSGNTKSCGCLKSEVVTVRNKGTSIHNLCKTKFYYSWRGMKERCSNSIHPNWNNYGARGIKVCEEWLIFENFRDDMYESYLEHNKLYGKRNTTIERIDVNGNYFKDNCKWATNLEQQNNKRNKKLIKAISPDGKVILHKGIKSMANEYNFSSQCIKNCLGKKSRTHKGWTFVEVKDISNEAM